MPLLPGERDDAALRASLHDALARRPDGDVWLFVYGFLAVEAPFPFEERRLAALPDRVRRFCLLDPVNRGTDAARGIALGLAPGPFLAGFAYRLSLSDLEATLLPVWREEMRLPYYDARWMEGRDEDAARLDMLVFDTAPSSPWHRPDLSEARVAGIIGEAAGSAGSNLDYLHDTREAFARAGIIDAHLERVAQLVQAPQNAERAAAAA